MWRFPRVEAYQEGEADEVRQLELDSVEEARVNALTQSARYLQGVRRYHDRNVQQRSFNIGDLVLRRIQDETGLHKLNSRWEGPFIVTKVTRPGSYKITDADGNELAWTCYNFYQSTPTKLAGENYYFHGGQDMVVGTSWNILRPETIESLMYVWRLTGNETYQDWGWDIFEAFEKNSRIESGYVGLKDVSSHHHQYSFHHIKCSNFI